MREIGGFAAEGIDDGNLIDDVIGMVHHAVVDQIRNQRMEPVDADEFLREIEGRAEVIGAAVHIGTKIVVAVHAPFRVLAAQAENAGAGRENGEKLI